MQPVFIVFLLFYKRKIVNVFHAILFAVKNFSETGQNLNTFTDVSSIKSKLIVHPLPLSTDHTSVLLSYSNSSGALPDGVD